MDGWREGGREGGRKGGTYITLGDGPVGLHVSGASHRVSLRVVALALSIENEEGEGGREGGRERIHEYEWFSRSLSLPPSLPPSHSYQLQEALGQLFVIVTM